MIFSRWFRPGWPLAALLCLYPLWWALGIGEFAFVIFAIPMAWDLRRRHPISLPPGFGLWMLFLAWQVLSATMLPLDAPNTIGGSVLGRTIGVLFRLFQFGAVTVIALYVGNLPIAQVSQHKIMRWLSVLFLVTVAGGFLGLLMPHFAFNSPFEHLLPHSVDANRYVKTLVHPQAAEVQSVLGYTAPRPAAPWGYTNYWGNNLSILLVWFCAYMWTPSSGRRRLVLAGMLVVTLVPIVYSLNRGMWFGLILSVLYIIYRLAARGDMRAALAAVILVPVSIIAFLLTPLHDVVQQRADHGGSNQIRAFLDSAAIHGAFESPILGWGGTRKTIGSGQSIAVGPSPKCPNCGSAGIGSTGEFWQIAFSQGVVGIGIYFAFFIAAFWGLRRDRSPTGAAARLVVLLALFYSYFYNSLPSATALTLISITLSWRAVTNAPPEPPPPPPLMASPTLSPLVGASR
jgi:hypothetical protein